MKEQQSDNVPISLNKVINVSQLWKNVPCERLGHTTLSLKASNP